MSTPVQALWVLHNNPFALGYLLPVFYGALEEKSKSLLLSYLVFPLALYPESQKFLRNANVRSSVRTLLKDKSRIFGLEERIAGYRRLTNLSIQHKIDNGLIRIGDDMAVLTDLGAVSCPEHLAGAKKAAGRLGVLFRPFDVPSIYRFLGLRRL